MRWPDLASAEAEMSCALRMALRIRASSRGAEPADLAPDDRAVLAGLGEGARRRDWLLGRAALKAVVEEADTSAVRFPSPDLSLTHACGMAVAVSGRSPGGPGLCGLGIDFEGWRATDFRSARFFLHDSEAATAAGPELLRLWTVKEALFKATLDNRSTGAGLLHYALDDPAAAVGSASDRRGRRFRYVSGFLPEGPLAVAVATA